VLESEASPLGLFAVLGEGEVERLGGREAVREAQPDALGEDWGEGVDRGEEELDTVMEGV
jgi:hypothetical protein